MASTCDTFVFHPGDGLYLPSFVPHWVEQTGADASISFSIPFYTRYCRRGSGTSGQQASTATAPHAPSSGRVAGRRSGQGFAVAVLDQAARNRCRCCTLTSCRAARRVPRSSSSERNCRRAIIVTRWRTLALELEGTSYFQTPDWIVGWWRTIASDRRRHSRSGRTPKETAGTRRPEPNSATGSTVVFRFRSRSSSTPAAGPATPITAVHSSNRHREERRRLADRCRRPFDAPSPGRRRGK